MSAYFEYPTRCCRDTSYTSATSTMPVCDCRNCTCTRQTIYFEPAVSNINCFFEPLPPAKNWRWFHIFGQVTARLIDAVRDQLVAPLSLHRYQAKISHIQRRRTKRRFWLQELRA